MNEKCIIWQYWETKRFKPSFVDGLHEIAKNNSGAEVVLVTPETIQEYIPNIPDEIFQIEEVAHKADMIRALLIYHHGGMWLDSDAIVLSDLGWLFEMLSEFDFIGFNNNGCFKDQPLNVRINCFLSRPKSKIMEEWINAQQSKFPKVKYSWTEVGTDLLDPIILQNKQQVKLLPFEIVCPIKWNEVSRFFSKWNDSKRILKNSHIVMLSNKFLHKLNPVLTKMSVEELSNGDTLIADIIKKSLNSNYEPLSFVQKALCSKRVDR